MSGKQKTDRRKRLAVLIGTPALISAIGASVLFVGGPASQAAAIRADLANLLSSRSPGGRQAGALTTSKPARPQAATERVLSPIRHRRPVAPAAGAAPAEAALPATGLPDVPGDAVPVGGPTVVDATPDVGGLGGPVALSPGAIFAPSSAGSPGGGQTAGGSTTPPTGATVTPPAAAIVSAVPEPSTWATLILGFLLLGFVLRRFGPADSDVSRILRHDRAG